MKKILFLSLIVTLIFTNYVVMAEDKNEALLLSELSSSDITAIDFSDYLQDRNLYVNPISGISLGNIPSNGSAVIQNDPLDATKTTLALKDDKTDSSGTYFTFTPTNSLQNSFCVETEVMTDSTLYIDGYNGNTILNRFLFRNENDILLEGISGQTIPAVGYQYKNKNVSYKIKIEYNSRVKTYHLEVTSDAFSGLTVNPAIIGSSITGNTFQVSNYAYNSASAGLTNPALTSIRFTKSHGNGTSYIKYIRTKVYEAPTLDFIHFYDVKNTQSILENVVPVDIKSLQIGFKTSEATSMDEATLSQIVLRKKENGEVFLPISSVDDSVNNSYTISFDRDLAYNTIYELLIPNTVLDKRGLAYSGTTSEFLTQAKELSVLSQAYKVGTINKTKAQLHAGDCLSLALSINTTIENKSVTLVLCLYVDDVLTDLAFQSYHTIPFDGVLESGGITISPNYDSTKTKIKGYLWEGVSPIRPLSDLLQMD